MPLDFGDHATRLRPASGFISEVCVGTPHFVRRTANGALEQVADPFPQNPAGRRMTYLLGFLADFLSRTRSPPSWAALLHVVSFDRAGVEVSTRRKARWVSGLDKTTARDHDPAAATPFDRFHRAGTGDDRSRRDLDRATWTLDESDPVVNITNHPVRD
jgi:hypothetical protein